MTERRQAFRREPIEIDFGNGVISIAPVPWLKRNDFGNELMRQHSEIINEAVKVYVSDDTPDAVPQIEAKFAEKFTDPYVLMKYGLDEPTYAQVMGLDLDFEQVVEVLLAICDVNKLDQLKPLIDPNSLSPTLLGGLLSMQTEGNAATPKIESGPDSSSPDSAETQSQLSLIPNLPVS